MAILAVFLASFWLMVWITTERDVTRANAERVALRIKSQHDEVERIIAERKKRAEEQKLPEVKDQERLELAAARQLITRRAFNWDHLITEMEFYVPKQARITGLKIEQVTALGQSVSATVELKAVGRNSGQMTEMMEAFGRSGGLFAVRQTTQDAPDEAGGIPFTLNLVYSPSRGAEQ
jgi:hypothetical protein